MTQNEIKDLDLDALFAQERDNVTAVPDDLFNRIMQDAQAQTVAQTKPGRVATSNGWISQLLSSLGGWQSVGALTACACFGLYLGYSTTASSYLGVETIAQSDDSFGFENSFSSDALYDVSVLEG